MLKSTCIGKQIGSINVQDPVVERTVICSLIQRSPPKLLLTETIRSEGEHSTV